MSRLLDGFDYAKIADVSRACGKLAARTKSDDEGAVICMTQHSALDSSLQTDADQC